MATFPINGSGGYPNHDWHKKPATVTSVSSFDPFLQLQNMLKPWTFGFERQLDLFRELEGERVKSSYPPYNIKHLPDDKAQIEVAIAGFTKKDVKITYKENILTVTGNRGEEEAEYAHKGIATRNFEQKFAIADDVIVKDAKIADGLLTIDLERLIPEEKKEREIKIH